MSRCQAKASRDLQTLKFLQMPPGRCLELSVYTAGGNILTCQHTRSWQLSLDHIRGLSSLYLLIPSVVIQNYLYFLLALWEFLYFSPIKLVFNRRPFLASNTYTASFLSVFIISMTLECLLQFFHLTLLQLYARYLQV